MASAPFSRILHVDDQPDIRGIVKLALGKIGGYEVCSCGSGEEALAAAPGFAPEILLIDMSMPGMDGMALLARFREAGIGVPAIFFTARIQPADLARYRAAGAIGTVSKPFDPLKLGRQIAQIWAENIPPSQESAP